MFTDFECTFLGCEFKFRAKGCIGVFEFVMNVNISLIFKGNLKRAREREREMRRHGFQTVFLLNSQTYLVTMGSVDE
jgi:hypothetical protein